MAGQGSMSEERIVRGPIVAHRRERARVRVCGREFQRLHQELRLGKVLLALLEGHRRMRARSTGCKAGVGGLACSGYRCANS